MIYQYWQHKTSGDKIAIQLDEQGNIKGYSDWLYYADVTSDNLENFNFESEEDALADFESRRDEYRLIESDEYHR